MMSNYEKLMTVVNEVAEAHKALTGDSIDIVIVEDRIVNEDGSKTIIAVNAAEINSNILEIDSITVSTKNAEECDDEALAKSIKNVHDIFAGVKEYHSNYATHGPINIRTGVIRYDEILACYTRLRARAADDNSDVKYLLEMDEAIEHLTRVHKFVKENINDIKMKGDVLVVKPNGLVSRKLQNQLDSLIAQAIKSRSSDIVLMMTFVIDEGLLG